MIIRFRDEMEMRIRNALAISKRAVENYHGRIIGISGEVSALVGRQGIEGREVITWVEGGGAFQDHFNDEQKLSRHMFPDRD